MSSSEDYLRGLASASGDWGRAVREFRDWYGSKAADVLAAAEGVSRRTAERWIAKAEGRTSQSSEPKPMAQVGIVNIAKNHRAAQRLRAATRIHPGSVEVVYAQDGRDEGERQIPAQDITGALATARDAAADLIAGGDYARAADLLDAAILDAYGVPEDTLAITDYTNGFEIE